MDTMDIIPPRPFGDRKRSWGEEEYEPPKKRTPRTWIRERPPVTELDYPIIQQVQNIALSNAQGNDVQMIMDEPVRQRPIFLPPSPISRPISPPRIPQNTPAVIPPPNSAEILTQSMATTTSNLARPLDPTQISSNPKKRFAIGPRADCEKCRAREPGHYGHWL